MNEERFDFNVAILRAQERKIVTNLVRSLCGFYLNQGPEIFWRNVRDSALTFPVSFGDIHSKSWRELDSLDELN